MKMKKILMAALAMVAVLSLGKMNAQAADYKAANNQWITISQASYLEANYIKYKAPATGRLVVSSQYASGSVWLCNSSKKVISASGTTKKYGSYVASESPYPYQQTVTFGVKKGKTYFVKLKANSNTEYGTPEYGSVKVNLKTTKISEKSGSKRTKAKAVKKGKTVKGTIIAGTKTADWYKCTLTTRKSVKFYFNGETNDTLKVSFYQGSRKIATRYINRGFSKKSVSERTIRSDGKWPKGTYYVKIERNYTGSGWYSLKWK